MNSCRYLLIPLSFVAAVYLDLPALAQNPVANSPASSQQSDSAIVLDEPKQATPIDVTAAAIEKIKLQATDAEQLADETRTKVIGLCSKAIAKLADADALAATTDLLKQELDEAGSALEALQSNSTNPNTELIPAAELSADEMRARLSAADQRASAIRERAQKVAAEIERRAERRKALPADLAKCREQLGKAEATLKREPKKDETPLLTEANRLYQTTRRAFYEKQLQALEQETRTYEATSRLWLAHHDAADKQLQQAINAHKTIHDLTAQAQRQEAELQAREARRAAVNAHPAVKAAATKNAELAERNEALVGKTQQIQNRLMEARDLGQTIQHRLADVTKRAEAARNTPAIGVMLRSQQDQLPALGPYRDRLRTRPVEISQLGLDIYEWELQRREVLHVDKAVQSTIQEIEPAAADSMREDIAAELRRVLEARAGILADVINNGNDSLSRLEELDAAENEVVAATEKLESFVAEHVLWVRSAPILSLDEFSYVRTFWSDTEGRTRQVQTLEGALRRDARQRPFTWSLAAVLVVALIVGRGQARKVLRSAGDAAAKPTATQFYPTVEASLATIFLASPVPVVLGFIGWRLCNSENDFLYASGCSVALFATAYAILDLLRHALCCGGLGTNHFGWDQKGLVAIRRAAKSLQLLALPLLAIAVGVEVVREEASINAIGRLSLVSSLLVIGVICFRLFRSTGPLAATLACSAKECWSARSVRIIAPLATMAVLGLIAASMAGYHYSAMQLTRRVFVSCVIVFACLALRSILTRWLLLAYRKVAMQRAREKRQAILEAQENASAEIPVIETEPHVSLTDINQQARKLVGAGTGLAFLTSIWFIWGDMLPALGIFNHVELWTSGLVSADPDAVPTFITLTDLIIAGAIVALTLFAGRNLPGLLEIAVLQKLPLDAGARYAASSVTRYVIFVFGVALGMRQLGIGWNSVQWLVAAMTVGLGFGLQEIFANFVAGIILLFERPIRVGDTVTVGDITGTVTKIRIRATTILDWNNKELIVPNKEFVTGNLVNWTLTNANLRLVINVGVAYGSNTRLATELLYRVAKENSNVLSEPEPVVVFNEFGDSSLNFELRLFVSDLTMYRRLRHDLHMAIDDLFRQHNVEIAFPQCDLHIKTMPAALQGTLSASHSTEFPDRQDAAA